MRLEKRGTRRSIRSKVQKNYIDSNIEKRTLYNKKIFSKKINRKRKRKNLQIAIKTIYFFQVLALTNV